MARIEVKGLDGFRSFIDRHPERSRKAEVAAVNTTARFGYAEASRGIRSEVNLSRSYIGSPTTGNRLKITRYAQSNDPKAVITARKRATSLARFADSKSFNRKAGVRVKVKAGGSTKRIKKGFLLRLKRGASMTEDKYNIGLALRLKPGERVRNKNTMRPFGDSDPNLYLLYAPSVDQVFRGVAGDIEPKVSSYLRREFLRQYERYSRG